MEKKFKAVAADWVDLPIVISVDEMSRLLGISRITAYSLIAQEGFPKVRVGKVFKVYRDGLKRWLEQG